MFCQWDNGVEKGNDDDGGWECCVPVIANATADSKGVYECEIGNGDEYNVEPDDDEGSNAEIGDNVAFDTVESFTSVEHSEKETEIDGVEEGNV